MLKLTKTGPSEMSRKKSLNIMLISNSQNYYSIFYVLKIKPCQKSLRPLIVAKLFIHILNERECIICSFYIYIYIYISSASYASLNLYIYVCI